MRNNSIKSVILAAGKGTRMKSTESKVLHKVLGKSLIERVLNNVLNIQNLDEIFVIVGHQSEKLTDFIDQKYSKSKAQVKTVLQEPQLGTGDAVFKAYDSLKGFNGTVLITCGDTPLLTTETLSSFIDYHRNTNAALSVLSAVFEEPGSYGRIVRNKEGNIEKIVEAKDASDEEKAIKEVNAGVYCLEWEKISPAFFELTTNNAQGEYYLTDIIDWACNKGLKTQAFILEDNNEIFGINSRIHLAEATKILNQKTLENLMENGVTIVDPNSTWISPETQIGQDTIIYPGCVIEGENSIGNNCVLGPDLFISGNVKTKDNVKLIQSNISNAVIGESCSVGPFAHLRDGVELNSNIRVGNFVEIKKSSVDSNTNISHLSYVGDSSLGKEVNIGAGTITANYNALTKEKSKTIIEDGVKIGSNSVLVAPVRISTKSNVAAGSVITKDVPASSLAIARGSQKIIEGWVEQKTKNLVKS